MRKRQHKVRSWYLDLSMLEKYWGEERVSHHTAPVSMNYALRETLYLVCEEGLKARYRRHERNHRTLAAGLSGQDGHRLWTLNSVTIPGGVDDRSVQRHDEFPCPRLPI